MTDSRGGFRRAEDRFIHSKRVVVPYLFVVIGCMLALWMLKRETTDRLAQQRHTTAAINAETQQRTVDNERLIRQLQQARMRQRALNHQINLVNNRQTVLIEELQHKFPGEFRQRSVPGPARVSVVVTRHRAQPAPLSSPHRTTPSPLFPPRPSPAAPPVAPEPSQPPQQQPVVPKPPTICVLIVCVP